MKKILVVVAHPDDEVLGCGGTIARYSKSGNMVYCLILGEGVTSRYSSRRKADFRKVRILKKQAKESGQILGIEKIYFGNFPDNRFDAVPFLDIIKMIEDAKEKIRPDIIYTHHYGDLNIDHCITHKAVMTACRPLAGDSVKEIYSFEIPSSTEWGYEGQFLPDVYVDITETFDKKLKALKVYRGEIKKFPHPRSPESLEIIAKRWGIKVAMNMAEPFRLLRSLKK